MSGSARAGTGHPSTRSGALTRTLRRSDRLLRTGREASARLSRWRLVLFLVGAACTVTPYKMAAFHAGNTSLLIFIIVFAGVARYHSRLDARIQRLGRWQEIKREHLARLSHEWARLSERRYPIPPDHPFAIDLDLIGPSSLLHLLDTTVSTMGRERLTAWLTQQPASLPTWRNRRRLIMELAPLAGFRDRLALAARLLTASELDGRRIQQAVDRSVGIARLDLLLAIETALVVATVGLAAGALVGILPSYWVLSLALYAFLYMWFLGDTEHLFNRAMTIRDELAQLVSLFQHLEQRPCRHAPELRSCLRPFHEAQRPSHHLRRLSRICNALSARAHPLVHLLLNAAVPWDLWFLRRLERARLAVSEELPTWLDCLAEIEAAGALANFAYLHPTYAWPTLVEAAGNGQPARIGATALGHPLLPSDTRVANDFTIEGIGRIVLITGSNMSGKSTFLRTVGINLCLAQAGAPVCATGFRWSWSRLCCCIRVSDSLEAGLSYFYAEVKRLRALLDAAQDRRAGPVLFLIDEIFKGTNNRERLAGSRAYIAALAKTNGFGLISTHDLELAELQQQIPALTNAHFQETVADSSLRFDYRLRPGPCTTTNALRIMANEGLPVPDETP